jgi:hypothetical protein
MFVRKHGIKTHRFTTPFLIQTADGKLSENPIMHYCHLAIKIDGRLMFGQFNIMNMSDRDMILLGKPWLTAMNPDINWAKDTLQLPSTPRSSGFFFVGKKDGSLQPCQDYHYINEWTIKNAYPLPLIPPLITKLSDAKFFTKMDVRSGYNNILIHPDDRWKAAFTTSFGLFELKVMFFGLCNSPATFQAYMNQTFQKEIAEGWMIIYMDDILIFLKTLEENQKRTRQVLEIIRKETLFLKPEKCTFDAQEVDYLGMIIHPGQVAMDPAKLSGISQWQTPTSVKEVRSFLGFCNFYRHFISHYSNLARPLIDLTKKDTVFAWTQACTDSFEKLKQCFLSEPVLRNPDPS